MYSLVYYIIMICCIIGCFFTDWQGYWQSIYVLNSMIQAASIIGIKAYAYKYSANKTGKYRLIGENIKKDLKKNLIANISIPAIVLSACFVWTLFGRIKYTIIYTIAALIAYILNYYLMKHHLDNIDQQNLIEEQWQNIREMKSRINQAGHEIEEKDMRLKAREEELKVKEKYLKVREDKFDSDEDRLTIMQIQMEEQAQRLEREQARLNDEAKKLNTEKEYVRFLRRRAFDAIVANSTSNI